MKPDFCPEPVLTDSENSRCHSSIAVMSLEQIRRISSSSVFSEKDKRLNSLPSASLASKIFLCGKKNRYFSEWEALAGHQELQMLSARL